jgi:small subunit ribosomal protein S20
VKIASYALRPGFGRKVRKTAQEIEDVMAHNLSAKKRIRQNAKKRLHNRSVRAELRSTIKRFRQAVTKKSDDAGKLLSAAESKLDKAAKRNIVPTQRANRIKGRLKKLMPQEA